MAGGGRCDYGMIAVRADSPYKTLKRSDGRLPEDPNSVVFGAGASIGSEDWMKPRCWRAKSAMDPRKMRYVALKAAASR